MRDPADTPDEGDRHRVLRAMQVQGKDPGNTKKSMSTSFLCAPHGGQDALWRGGNTRLEQQMNGLNFSKGLVHTNN